MAVVEVVPLVAGTAPIIVGSGVVGAIVGVLRLLVQSAGLGVLDERLGVQVGRLLAVKDGAHTATQKSELISTRTECGEVPSYYVTSNHSGKGISVHGTTSK